MAIRPHEKITAEIGGKTYPFTTPKSAIILSAYMDAHGKSEMDAYMILMKAQLKWMRRGLGPEAWKEIALRINDDDDELDISDIIQEFEEITRKSTDRPTMSSPASSGPSQETTFSEEKPNPEESIFGI